jgi:hypothetical protein
MNRAVRLLPAITHRPYARSLVAGAFLLLAIGLMQSPPGKSLLRSAGLRSGPERYTALAFAKPADLPGQLRAHGVSLRIPFSLRNEEGRAMVYRWAVSEVGARGRRQIAAGSTALGAGESLWVRPGGRVGCAGSRTRIEVLLTGRAESIGFWTACPPAARR